MKSTLIYKKFTRLLASTQKRKVYAAMAFTGLFAVVAIITLSLIKAATPAVSLEAESGQVAGAAALGSDTAASSGQYVKFQQATQPPTTSGARPVIVGHQLQTGNTGARLKMKGVNVWGGQGNIPGRDFQKGQYDNRVKIVNNIKGWGANEVRFALDSLAYNGSSADSKKVQLQQVKDWRDLIVGQGMYFHVCWWDAYNMADGWGSRYGESYGMMKDVAQTLGDDPMVIYEPNNEPHGPSDGQWLTASKAMVNHFRNTIGYKGVLLMDMLVWSHAYNDNLMTQLEQYDASMPGMNGKHQLIFAKHDYANEGYGNPNGGFDNGYWARNTGNGTTWDFNKHLAWETEFGNYNGDASTVHIAWSAGAATWMADRVNDGTLVGATPFLYGPWYDTNAMTTGDNVTPTQWGNYAKNNFLARVQ